MNASDKSTGTLAQLITDADGDEGPGPIGGRADQLAYMADMILELQQMAARGGLGTLAGILGLAHTEARLQSARSD
ncbi:MAG: hypothetical protein KDJ37_03095 [Hyphomicrobiaceae bacterium]|nr:hypothetical protein [Hyphomicrobiaceae bacterium]